MLLFFLLRFCLLAWTALDPPVDDKMPVSGQKKPLVCLLEVIDLARINTRFRAPLSKGHQTKTLSVLRMSAKYSPLCLKI